MEDTKDTKSPARAMTFPTDSGKSFPTSNIDQQQQQKSHTADNTSPPATTAGDNTSINPDLNEIDKSRTIPPLEYRIVLVGRSGEGKTATLNTIFGRKVFDAKACAEGVTAECQDCTDTIEGRKLFVVDTPGLFDPKKPNTELKPKILKFIGITSPGPHAILLVMKVGRFTEEVGKTYEHVRDLLGNEGHQYTILVLTGGDDLEHDGIKIEDYLENAPEGLTEILNDTGHRYVVFNNRLKGDDRLKQITKLLCKIDEVIKENKGGWYESAPYNAAERALREKEREEREAIIRKKDEEMARLRAKLEEKQSEVEKLQKITEQKEQVLKHQNQGLIAAERNFEEKRKTLKANFESDLIKVREETRQKINDNKLDVSQPWFTSKFKAVGQKLKQIIGL